MSLFIECRQNSLNTKYKFTYDILRTNCYKALEFSYIGEYEKMLEMSGIDYSKSLRRMDTLSIAQISQFLKYKAVDAKSVILEKAKTEQIIIINEEHQQPYHRVFTTSLLRDLYKAGFRYFSAETLTNYNFLIKKIRKKKYPTFSSGFYSQEPFYGNLIREAAEIGYKIFGYESNRLMFRHFSGISQREIDQAKNIQKILKKDPNAKILIHCGYDHIVETHYPGWGKAMAGRLYEFTGIDPFTIDQVNLTEHSLEEQQNPYWSLINLDYYAMFVDSSGQLFSGLSKEKRYDAEVYHPKTNWKFGRPQWVFENGRTPYFIRNKINLKFPCLVFAFIKRERKQSKKAIPFDIIELKSATENKALSLKKGEKYTIDYMDVNFQEQTFDIQVD
ncbi:MAG: hypothetical protein AB7O73_09235 [Bacteroidia bacterium]